MDDLTQIKKCLIFGQADYVDRIQNYILEISPNTKIEIMKFPLNDSDPDKTTFDFSLYDEQLKNIPHDMLIYVGFAIKYHDVLRDKFTKFSNTRFYDVKLDNEMKTLFWKSKFKKQGKNFDMIYDLKSTHANDAAEVKVYMAKFFKDKSVSSDTYEQSNCLIPIQVGAALTDKRVADVTDDTGDNISTHNPHYSEMTAFYWMWKNVKADYLGICHYRRIWINLNKIAEKLQTTDVEVILPLPTLCRTSIREDHMLRYIPDVWSTMMDVLKRKSPEYYEVSKNIFEKPVMYASNMCILKRNVFDDLCSWLFSIVMEVENIIGDLPDVYRNRYAGFCTEELITLYFLYNKQNWSIAHAEKLFIAK